MSVSLALWFSVAVSVLLLSTTSVLPGLTHRCYTIDEQ